MFKIQNNQVRKCVQNREEFSNAGGTLYGGQIDRKYVVYSYGKHFPLLIWDGKCWHGNKDKYSKTTSKHLSQAIPVSRDLIRWHDTDEMVALVRAL